MLRVLFFLVSTIQLFKLPSRCKITPDQVGDLSPKVASARSGRRPFAERSRRR
ncbi:MAG: hypothetical protein LBB88_08100 [Planctomycetaceae bacterium]|nr:hypothetical protein [Planctomycetaceae bacterium]